MQSKPFLPFMTALTLTALLVSCSTTRLPPISNAGDAFEPLRDEQRLWERARDEESALRENVEPYEDPLLVGYLEGVVGRLNPAEMAANPEIGYRVVVLEDPTLNAFAFPHGSIYVHTGLLARMDNEDQLATVLAHEMTHVEGRHMLRHQRSARNKQIGFGIGALAAAVILAGEEGQAASEGKWGKAARIGVLSDVLIGLGLQLAFIAAVNGYGRDLEREADDGGLSKMAAVGYDVREAPEVYRALLDNRYDSGKAQAFFFGSHPRLEERIESAEGWVETNASAAAGAPHDAEAFARRIRPVIRDDARLNLERGRLALAQCQLERVREMLPDDPETHLLIGRLRLAQAERVPDPDRAVELRDQAEQALREAVRLDPEHAGPHRELGLLTYRGGAYDTACVQFRHYVELDPDAPDAGRIRDYILELDRDGHCP